MTEPSRTAEVSEIRGALAGDEALLAYFFGELDSYACFVEGSGGDVLWFPLRDATGKPLAAESVAREIGAVLAGMRATGGQSARGRPVGKPRDRSGDAKRAAHRLFALLMPAALWERVRNRPVLYLLPHGPLHRLPFEALIVERKAGGETPRYWIDDGPPIAYQESGSAMVWSLRRRVAQIRDPGVRDALILADPDYSAPAAARGPKLERLEGARREAEAARSALRQRDFANVRMFTGADATERQFAVWAKRAAVVHLAAHQIHDPLNRWQSGRIALTPPAVPTAEDDGFLDLDDLLVHWRGELEQCGLVVLSTCSSRTGLLNQDEGFFALPMGFRFAGCPTVVASMWPVDDAAAEAVMTSFYGALDDEGLTRLETFTAARRALKRARPDPFAWAPFVWTGAPR